MPVTSSSLSTDSVDIVYEASRKMQELPEQDISGLEWDKTLMLLALLAFEGGNFPRLQRIINKLIEEVP